MKMILSTTDMPVLFVFICVKIEAPQQSCIKRLMFLIIFFLCKPITGQM